MSIDSSRHRPLLADVDRYYSEKIRKHGATPMGVDWNSSETQALRFQVLSTLLPAGGFSLTDLGCGYGGYLNYVRERYSEVDYIGLDISAAMIENARSLNGLDTRAQFACASIPMEITDYVVASGIFNVRQQTDDTRWLRYIHMCIDDMHAHSRHGYAFNCLTSYSDEDRKQPYLYYADPAELFRYCMRHSRHVSLLHGYGLYEFTILVRKETTT